MVFEESISYFSAFLAGGLSFVSPCVLPLIPGYISFISGVSLEELTDREKASKHLWRVFVNTLFFVVGFSLVFIALGASASFIGQWLFQNLALFNKVAGVLIFLFGLHVAGVFRIKALNYEKRFHAGQRKFGVFGSIVIGVAFAFGWTPCIGPILGSILTMAANQDTISHGIILLTFYSAGLGIPFILTAVLFNFLIGFFGFIKRHFRAVEMISGGLLMLIGVLIFFNLLQVLANKLLGLFPNMNIG
ncbi:MAG: cytochrome c biogenesis protein CcdA [candidate division Zixibacteria bacterium]|nr:cytochrome c biogenesis protein CcdA [candidate division Zixibacteria bacterium]